MFRIKICGLTSVEDTQAVVAAGADALGLNFYEKSSRFVAAQVAEQIVASIPSTVAKVGVFVNASEKYIRNQVENLQLNYVQLHGDEPPAFLLALANLKLIKAFRVGPEGIACVDKYLSECQQLGRLPNAILLDAFSRTAYGGTGQTIDWNAVCDLRKSWATMPIILAGGLNPENVEQAILAAQPTAVDTASGVESSPGVKDHSKIAAFVMAAEKSFAHLVAPHAPNN